MRENEIKKIISIKYNEWLSNIPNEKLKEEIRENTFVSGGSIASLLLDQPINDLDIFFTNPTTCQKTCEYYVNLFKEESRKYMYYVEEKVPPSPHIEDVNTNANRGISATSPYKMYIHKNKSILLSGSEALEADAFEHLDEIFPEITVEKGFNHVAINIENPYLPGFGTEECFKTYGNPNRSCKDYPYIFTKNAITLSNDVQLILKVCDTPDKVHESFDFIHCTNYWFPKNNKLVLKEQAMRSLLTKELVFNTTNAPFNSLNRLSKMYSKGFSLSKREAFKLMFAFSKINFSSSKEIIENLRGLYSVDMTSLESSLLEHEGNAEKMFEVVIDSLSGEV